MPLPVAHALIGSGIALAFCPERTRGGARRALLAGSVLGVLSDADYLLNSVRIFGPGWHHGFTHSVAFAVVVGAAAAWVLGLRGWRGVAACILALLSHSLADFLFTESHGVALAWPFTDERFKLGWPPLHYYRLADLAAGSRLVRLGAICVVELFLFAPWLAAGFWFHRRQGPVSKEG